MLLSLSGFLFEDNYATQSVGFPEFCALARQFGYGGVELRETQLKPSASKDERAAFLRVMQDEGLVVTCLTARGLPQSGKEGNDFFFRYLDLCRDLDCRLLKIAADSRWLNWAAAQAAECEVVLASNNHIGGPLETVTGTRRILQEVDHPNFGLLYDSLHLRVAGEDYLGCVTEFAGRTRNILVHSLRPATDREVWLERNGVKWASALPDEPGTQDWRAIFSIFRRSGYDGLLTVIESGQCWPTEKRAYVAEHCGRVIRDMWQAAGEIIER